MERRPPSSDSPCACEPAWDPGYVQNGKVAEVEGVEVQAFEQGLQSFMGSRPLQSQQRSVIMNDEVCLLAFALQSPSYQFTCLHTAPTFHPPLMVPNVQSA